MYMGLLDRLLGRTPRDSRTTYSGGDVPAYGTPPPSPYPPEPGTPAYGTPRRQDGQQSHSDEEAVRRYRYLLRTAPPEAIEQAHAEAFAQLTPDQRRAVLEQLAAEMPEHERARDDDPRSLARMATRGELRQPGTLERVLGPRGGYGGGGYAGGGGGFGRGGGGFGMGGVGMGMGGMIAGSLLASVAGAFIGTAIADQIFDENDYQADSGGDAGGDAAGDAGGEAAGAEGSDLNFDNQQVDASGVDTGGDYGAADGGGGEAFGDFGGGGGGFGDFGGGDFGGGDW
jgi:hypothetical protein